MAYSFRGIQLKSAYPFVAGPFLQPCYPPGYFYYFLDCNTLHTNLVCPMFIFLSPL